MNTLGALIVLLALVLVCTATVRMVQRTPRARPPRCDTASLSRTTPHRRPLTHADKDAMAVINEADDIVPPEVQSLALAAAAVGLLGAAHPSSASRLRWKTLHKWRLRVAAPVNVRNTDVGPL